DGIWSLLRRCLAGGIFTTRRLIHPEAQARNRGSASFMPPNRSGGLVADEETFVGNQAIAADVVLSQNVARRLDLDAEPDARQAVGIVGSVQPHVIVLSETAEQLGRIVNGVFLSLQPLRSQRHLQQCPSP